MISTTNNCGKTMFAPELKSSVVFTLSKYYLAVVDYGPCDAAAVLCREMRLDRHYVPQIHRGMHMP